MKGSSQKMQISVIFVRFCKGELLWYGADDYVFVSFYVYLFGNFTMLEPRNFIDPI